MIVRAGSLTEKAKEKYSNELWEEYDEIIEEKVLKEWKRKGYTSRDWCKTKVIFYDEN